MESSDEEASKTNVAAHSQNGTRTRPVRNRRAPVIYGKSKEGAPRKRLREKKKNETKKVSKKSNLLTQASGKEMSTENSNNIAKASGVETVSTTNVVMTNATVKKELMSEFTINDTATASVSTVVKLLTNISKIARNLQVNVPVKPIEENIQHVMNLLNSDSTTDKENNENDVIPSKIGIALLNAEKIVPSPLKMPLNGMPNPLSTPTTPQNNMQSAAKSNNVRTPPAGILRKPDSPRFIGRRVHFDVESSTNDDASNDNGNSFRRRFKPGLLSPSRTQSPLQRAKSDPGSLKRLLELPSLPCNEKREKKSAVQLKCVGADGDDDFESTNMSKVALRSQHLFAFMPDYVNIKDTIRLKICQMLAPSTGSKILCNQLKSRGVFTVGQLASLSEVEVSQLYIRCQPTKVAKARAVISSLYLSLINPKPTPPVDINVLASPSVALLGKSGSNTLLLPDKSSFKNKDAMPTTEESKSVECVAILESPTTQTNVKGMIQDESVSTSLKSADNSSMLANKPESASATASLVNEAGSRNDTDIATSVVMTPNAEEATVLKATEKTPLVNVQIMELLDDENDEPMLNCEVDMTVEGDFNDCLLFQRGNSVVDERFVEHFEAEENIIENTTDVINAKIVEFGDFISNIDYNAWTPAVDNAVLHLVSKLAARMDTQRKSTAIKNRGN